MENRFFFFKGRVALYAILKAMGIGQGDEVILPGFTCVVVSNAITYVEAKPIYVDIDPDTYNIDPQKIEEKITKKTRAIIVQHTFGIPAEMDKIMALAKKYNFYVIEDSCHTIGSKYKGKEVGTIGDTAFFSSQWSKPITTGLGGWAQINNEELLQKMQSIYSKLSEPSRQEKKMLKLQYFIYSHLFKPSRFWILQNTYRTLSKTGITLGSSSDEELQGKMPANYARKMSNWHRGLLDNKFMSIQKIIDHRKQVAILYENILQEKGFHITQLKKDYEPVFLRYPILVQDKMKILSEAKEKRIEIGDWFLSPIHPNIDSWEKVGYIKGMCPKAETICRHIVNLPTHEYIDEKEVLKIIDLVTDTDQL